MKENDFCCRKLCCSSDSESQLSRSRSSSSGSDRSCDHILNNLDEPAADDDDEDSEDRFWRGPPRNSVSSDTSALCSVQKSMQSGVFFEDNRSDIFIELDVAPDVSSKIPQVKPLSHSDTIINGLTLRWPRYEIDNVLFKGWENASWTSDNYSNAMFSRSILLAQIYMCSRFRTILSIFCV